MSRVLSLAYTYYETDPRVRRMAEALAQAGHDVEALCLRAPGSEAEEILRGVRVRRLDMQRRRGGRGQYLAAYGRFLALAAAEVARLHGVRRYDVIHVNTMPDVLVFAALWPRLCGARVLLDFHDMMPELFAEKFGLDRAPLGGPGLFPTGGRRRGARADALLSVRVLSALERLSARGADHCLAVHDLQKERLVQNGIPADKITVILNAPDESLFVPQPRTRPRDGIRFVYHGTIAPRHGLDLAVLAFARARREREDLSFRIIGAGDGLAAVGAAVESEGLQDAVELREPVPVEQIPALVGDADVAVIPLRGGPAGAMMLPTKLLEYAALCIPAIVSRTPVVEHYFPEGAVAYLPPGDVDGLAREMLALADGAERRARMAARAREVIERHSFARQRRAYLDLIDGLSS